jgi:cold-inducible RNA-binding protein
MNKTIYVGNLNYSTTEESLRDFFTPFGEIDSVKMITDRDTGRFKGYAFVEMTTDDAAQSAILSLNGKELDGRPLRVNEARRRNGA